MSIFPSRPRWYVAGLAFECTGCGRCCAGPEEGYVWVTDEEASAIAEHLRIAESQMRRRYLRKVGRQCTLIERSDNKDCIFLRPNGGGKDCMIYPVRPTQCRTWPFWPGNLRDPDDWAVAGLRCKGINRGSIHPGDEIEAKRNATAR